METVTYLQTLSTATTSQAQLQMAQNFSELLTALRVQSWVPPRMPGVAVPVPTLQVPLTTEQPGGVIAPEVPPVATTTRTEIGKGMEGRQFQLRKIFVNCTHSPKTSTGQDIYCSYHMKGRYFSDCHRRATHRPLAQPDMDKLKCFVTDYIFTSDVGKEDT